MRQQQSLITCYWSCGRSYGQQHFILATHARTHTARRHNAWLAEQTRPDGAGTKHDASIKHERSFSSCRPLTGGPHRAPGQLGPTTRPERLFTYPLSLRRFSRRLHLIAKFIIPKQVIIRRNIVRRLANFRTTFSLQVVISWSWRRSIVNLKLEEFFDSDPLWPWHYWQTSLPVYR